MTWYTDGGERYQFREGGKVCVVALPDCVRALLLVKAPTRVLASSGDTVNPSEAAHSEPSWPQIAAFVTWPLAFRLSM